VSLVSEEALLIADSSAPLGASDTTRRFAVQLQDGDVRFRGVTRIEGAALCDRLRVSAGPLPDDLLVAVALPVMVSDGAGPYLLAADGSLVLVLGPHPTISGALVAMGQPNPDQLIGAVKNDVSAGWHWTACASVDPEQHIAALDGLAEATDSSGLEAWSTRWNR
jgi:hypothetical protein